MFLYVCLFFCSFTPISTLPTVTDGSEERMDMMVSFHIHYVTFV